MNNIVCKSLLAIIIALSISHQAMAAFVLNGTRFIYEEGKKNISFEITNNADETYGGQVWIDNTNQGTLDVYMIPSPPFFKVAAKGKQIVRIMNVNSKMPQEKESLFWINVQEVPPKPKETEGNVLAIAMNTQVKLIYRPKSLINNRKEAERAIEIVRKNGTVWLKNSTPYYFAITELKLNGKRIDIPKAQKSKLSQMPPFSTVNTEVIIPVGNITVEAINDWGGKQEYAIQ